MSTAPATHADADEEFLPRRPRLSVGKKVLLAIFLFLLSLILLHWWWGVKTGGALQAEIAKYHARGEPIRLEDFTYPDVLPETNAALDLRLSARAIKLSPEQANALRDWSIDLDHPDDRLAILKELLSETSDVLKGVRDARGKSASDWGIRLKSPMISILLPDLGEQRQLAQLLMLAADLSHRAGDDKTSLEYLDDLAFVGRSMADHPTLVGHMVALGINPGMLGAFVQRNAHELKVGGRQGAAREQVDQLVRHLLDEQPAREGARRALIGERAMQLDTAELLASGKMNLAALAPAMGAGGSPLPLPGALLRPLMQREALAMLRCTTRVIDAIAEDTWPAARGKADFDQIEKIHSNPTAVLVRLMLPAYNNFLERHYRTLAERRMLAAFLAVRLYQLDHDGKFPQSWTDLVSRYLPAIPNDPFAADGRPLVYQQRPEGPVIYSVNKDGKDDGGSEVTGRTGQKPKQNWQADDAVYRLVPAPREKAEPPAP